MLRSTLGRRVGLCPSVARTVLPTSASGARLLASGQAHGAAHGHGHGHGEEAHGHDDHHHDDHHHEESPGYLWSRKPGVQYPRESWEWITYFGIAATLILGYIAVSGSGKMTVEEMARLEIAKRRRERAAGVPEPEPLQLDVDPNKFRKPPLVNEYGPQ